MTSELNVNKLINYLVDVGTRQNEVNDAKLEEFKRKSTILYNEIQQELAKAYQTISRNEKLEQDLIDGHNELARQKYRVEEERDVLRKTVLDFNEIIKSNNETISRLENENLKLASSHPIPMRSNGDKRTSEQRSNTSSITSNTTPDTSDAWTSGDTKIDEFHLDKLPVNSTREEIMTWINDVQSMQYKRQRAAIAIKKFEGIVDEAECENIIKECFNSADPNIKKNAEFIAEYNSILKQFEAVEINIWSLWSICLPNNRLDSFNIYIVDDINFNEYDYDESTNYYNKATNTFYWLKYKSTTKFNGLQIRKLDDLKGILPNDHLEKVINFLNSRPNNSNLFTLSTERCRKKYKDENGYNMNSYRHFWSTWAFKNLDKLKAKVIHDWMFHDIATAARVYRN